MDDPGQTAATAATSRVAAFGCCVRECTGATFPGAKATGGAATAASAGYHAGVRERVLKALTTDRDNQDRLIASTILGPHQPAARGNECLGLGAEAFPRRTDHQDSMLISGEPPRQLRPSESAPGRPDRAARRAARAAAPASRQGAADAFGRPLRPVATAGPRGDVTEADTPLDGRAGAAVPPTRPLPPMHGAPSREPPP